VSALAWQMRDDIAEMDINPLLVLPKGQGVIAADALVVMKRASQ
jgi:acetyltransferase